MTAIASRWLVLAAASAAFAAAAGQSLAQPVTPAPQFKNLQVFPKTIARDQLMANMKFFAQSLGVRCTYCHVGTEGQPLSTFDFASDDKEAKRTARKMLNMVHRINEQDFGVHNFKDVKVTCFTCHRGSTEPLTEPPTSAAPPKPPGSERG